MIRLRSLKTGQVQLLPPGLTVEITDLEGNVGLLIMPDPMREAVQLITRTEEPEVALNYEQTFGIKFSRTMVPSLAALEVGEVPIPHKL